MSAPKCPAVATSNKFSCMAPTGTGGCMRAHTLPCPPHAADKGAAEAGAVGGAGESTFQAQAAAGTELGPILPVLDMHTRPLFAVV